MQAPAFDFENEALGAYRPVYAPVTFIMAIIGMTAFRLNISSSARSWTLRFLSIGTIIVWVFIFVG